jgi:hypothetical protein
MKKSAAGLMLESMLEARKSVVSVDFFSLLLHPRICKEANIRSEMVFKFIWIYLNGVFEAYYGYVNLYWIDFGFKILVI